MSHQSHHNPWVCTHSADKVRVHDLHEKPHGCWLILHHQRLALQERGVRVSLVLGGSQGPPQAQPH